MRPLLPSQNTRAELNFTGGVQSIKDIGGKNMIHILHCEQFSRKTSCCRVILMRHFLMSSALQGNKTPQGVKNICSFFIMGELSLYCLSERLPFTHCFVYSLFYLKVFCLLSLSWQLVTLCAPSQSFSGTPHWLFFVNTSLIIALLPKLFLYYLVHFGNSREQDGPVASHL